MSTQRVQGVLLFLVLAVNSARVQILCSYTLSYSSHPFLCALAYVYVTIKLLAHCHTLALFPQSQTSPTTTTTTTTTTTFTFRLHSQCIHNGSGLPLLCVIVNANERQKWGRLRTRLVTLYIQALYLCFVVSLFSLSCSWTNT